MYKSAFTLRPHLLIYSNNKKISKTDELRVGNISIFLEKESCKRNRKKLKVVAIGSMTRVRSGRARKLWFLL